MNVYFVQVDEELDPPAQPGHTRPMGDQIHLSLVAAMDPEHAAGYCWDAFTMPRAKVRTVALIEEGVERPAGKLPFTDPLWDRIDLPDSAGRLVQKARERGA